jgi:hypothetical protein
MLAYGLMQIKVGGYLGWRWIFIIEGLIPIALAPLGYWLIVDFPDKIHKSSRPFLNAGEIRIMKDRINTDRGDTEHVKSAWKTFLRAIRLWQIWV